MMKFFVLKLYTNIYQVETLRGQFIVKEYGKWVKDKNKVKNISYRTLAQEIRKYVFQKHGILFPNLTGQHVKVVKMNLCKTAFLLLI